MTIRVALLGAECTGKTTLAQSLQSVMAPLPGGARWIPEALRDWCAFHGRTPGAHEQAAIAQTQLLRVKQAEPCAILLVDTSPLMTAIYSDLLFADQSLYAMAIDHQRTYRLNLVLQPDLPWVADPGQRDGPQAQGRVHQRLLEVLHAEGIAFSLVGGEGQARIDHALQALAAAGLPAPR